MLSIQNTSSAIFSDFKYQVNDNFLTLDLQFFMRLMNKRERTQSSIQKILNPINFLTIMRSFRPIVIQPFFVILFYSTLISYLYFLTLKTQKTEMPNQQKRSNQQPKNLIKNILQVAKPNLLELATAKLTQNHLPDQNNHQKLQRQTYQHNELKGNSENLQNNGPQNGQDSINLNQPNYSQTIGQGLSATILHVPNLQAEQTQGINLHIRSQLIRRSRKYQISTNNAHKKYINCLKNLFYQALSHQQIRQFQSNHIKLKSSRVFFFIILVYVKYRFTQELGLAVKMGFERQMNQRIKQYEEQIYRCSDFMLKNYRYEEIHEIEIALKAIDQFYLGNTAEAIEYLYRKDKHIIVKQNHFRTSLKYIQQLEKQFAKFEGEKISKPFQKEHYHRSRFHNDKMTQKDEKRKPLCQVKYHDQKVKPIAKTKQSKQVQAFPQQMPDEQIQQGGENQVTPWEDSTQKNKDKKRASVMKQQNNQFYVSQEDQVVRADTSEQVFQSSEFNKPSLKPLFHMARYQNGSEIEEDQPLQESSANSHVQVMGRQKNIPNKLHELKSSEEKNGLIFPPIPPHFYLPEFDSKYGYLFRKAVYIRKWKQLNRRIFNPEQTQAQQNMFGRKGQYSSNNRGQAPSPLTFQNNFARSNQKN